MSGINLAATLPTHTDRKAYIVWMAIVWAQSSADLASTS